MEGETKMRPQDMMCMVCRKKGLVLVHVCRQCPDFARAKEGNPYNNSDATCHWFGHIIHNKDDVRMVYPKGESKKFRHPVHSKEDAALDDIIEKKGLDVGKKQHYEEIIEYRKKIFGRKVA